MSNFDVARQATETAITSEGSALKEQETYLSSLEAKTQQFKASFQSLSNTILDSDLLKFFVDLGTTGVSAIDGLVNALGGLGTIGLLGGAGLGVKNVGIFKTIQDELTGTTKSIGLFGKSWSELKESFSNFKSGGFSGLFSKSTIDVSAVQKYNEALLTTKDSQKALEISTIGVNAETKSLIASANGAAVSETALATAQKSATVASKAAAIGWKALNVAMNVGVMFLITEGISLAVKGLDNLIHATENAKESISNLESEYSDGVSSLDSMNTELTTTKDRIDELQSKGTLTFTEKDELENLKTQNAELQRSIDLQKEKNKASSTKTVGEIRDDINKLNKGFTSDLNDYSNQKKEVDQDNSYYDTQKRIGADSEYLSNIEESIAQESDVLASFKDSVIQNIQDYQKYKEDIVNAYGDDKTLWDKNTLDMYNSLDEQVQKAYKEIYTNAQYNKLVIEPVFDKDGLSGLQDELLQYFAKNGSLDESELKKKFGSSIIEALKSACSDAGVDFSDMLNDMNKNAQQKVKEIFNAPSTVNSTYSAKQKVNSDAKKDAYDKLSDEDKTIVLNAKIPDEVKNGTEKDFNDWVEKLKSKAKENPIEISVTSAGDSLETMSKDIKNLSSAYSEFKDNGFSDIGTMGGISDAFKDLKSYESFVKVAGDVNSSAEDIQKSFNNLVTEYVYTSGVLDGLTEDTKGLYQSQLEAMGITNASAIVNSDYANALSYAAEKGIDLSKATYEDIMALVNEKEISEETRQAMAALAIEKFKVGATGVGRASDISELEQLAEMAGIAKDKLTDLKNAKSALSGKVPGMPTESAQKQADSAIKSTKKKIEKETASYKPTANYSKTKTKSSGSSAKSKSTKDTKKDKSKTKIDWIARKLERLQKVIDATKSKFENLFDLKSKSSNLDSQIKQTTDLSKSNQKAADKYKKYADKVKLSKDLKKKVREGNYSIKNYSSKTADKINKYKEYYDNYKEAKQQVEELTTAIRELKEEKYQLYVDDAESNIDKLNAQKDIAVGYANQNSKLDAQKTYLKQSYDYQIKIADLTKDKVKKAQLQVEYQKQLRDLEKEKFENIQAYYDSQIKLLDLSQQKIEDRISLLETKGMTINAKYYEGEIAYQKAIMQQYNTEYSKLKGQLAAMEKAGMKGTDDWYDKVEALSEVESEITNCNTSIAEMNNKITEVGMSIQNKILSNIKSVSEEMEWATSLMSEMDMFKENSGAFTNEGLTTLGSYASGYNNSKYASKLSAGLVNEMNKALKTNKLEFTFNGQSFKYNSIEQLKDAITEANETWRDQITETYEYSNKIIDMMVDKLQSELSALQELIENKKNALTAEQDLYNYQKSIRESVDNAASLEKQIAALQGNNSEENMMKIQKLQDELSKAQDDLQEKEYDRYISDQQDMLDKLYSEYESLINAETKDRDALLQKGIQAVELSSQTISQTIGEYADKYNYTDVLGNIKTGLDIMTGNDSPLNSIKTSVLNAIAPTGTIPTAISGLNATLTNIAGSIAQKILKSSNPNAKSNTGDTSSPSTKENILSGGLKRKKVEDVFGNSKYYAKGKKKKASDYKTKINQVLFKKNKKVLTDAGLKQLRKIFNTTNDGIYQAMLDLSKAVGNIKNVGGFKTGGIARLIKGSGEDGLAMVRNGEGFIAPEHIKPIQDLVNLTPQLNDMLKPVVDLTSMYDIKPVNRDSNVSIDIGNIELHDVQDPKQFASQLVNVVQKDRNVQNMFKDLTDIPVNRNYNRLGINKYK